MVQAWSEGDGTRRCKPGLRAVAPDGASMALWR